MASKLTLGVAAISLVAVTGTTPGNADPVADFYKDQVGIMAVGFSPGGGYDRYSRLVVNHLGKYIPGKPAFVPQFMPGGGSLKMANYTYNVAPKNGTFIGLASPMLPIFQLIRSKGFKLDVRKLSWLGRLATQKHVMMVRADTGIKSLEDLKKKEIVAAASGLASPTYMFPAFLNSALGTKFKIIKGYKGSAGTRLALERGEANALSSGWISWKSNVPQWIESKFIIPVVELGFDKSPDLPKHVPLILDLAKTKADREFMEFMMGPTITGRAIFGPPGLPKARLAALRAAYDKMVKDPDFLAEAKRRKIEVHPMGGAEIAKRVTRTASASAATVKRAKEALGFK
ncbi:MAG: hypothetical protein CMM52_09750 [Rhodospirillaceae bacterium]|nr:hypothetical protein [Rhodospirillaceae bacterium]|tara:strand:- start:18147 stop:19178 length:1032 start_codon:yes stop_codon:yes gene_type:complete